MWLTKRRGCYLELRHFFAFNCKQQYLIMSIKQLLVPPGIYKFSNCVTFIASVRLNTEIQSDVTVVSMFTVRAKVVVSSHTSSRPILQNKLTTWITSDAWDSKRVNDVCTRIETRAKCVVVFETARHDNTWSRRYFDNVKRLFFNPE